MPEPLAFEVQLSESYEDALESIAAALKVEGFGILTKIDVRSTLMEKIGVEFRPYAILGVCNPQLAHRTLAQDGRAGLMLPCNVTVEATDEGSLVRIVDPVAMLAAADMEKDPILAQVASEARQRLQRVARALAD